MHACGSGGVVCWYPIGCTTVVVHVETLYRDQSAGIFLLASLVWSGTSPAKTIVKGLNVTLRSCLKPQQHLRSY